MNARPILVSAIALATAIPALAQDREVMLHSDTRQLKQSAKEVEDIGEITAVAGTESDGKTDVAPAEPTPKRFRFSANARAAYTSNAQLSGNHSSGDFLFFPTLEAGYNVPLTSQITFDATARIESGLYARYDERAFIGYGANLTLDYRPRPTSPRIFISAEPYRYDNFDKGGLLTEAVGFSAGTDWGVPFNNGNSLFFVGYNYTYYLSDPSMDTRNQNRAVIGVTHTLRPQLYAQILYSYVYDNYTDFDRHDSRHVFGANLTWQVNRQLFATLSGSFVDNDSTQDRASYQSAGAAVQLSWQY